ncbi:diguanylate cyclase [Devosia rhodophyticola]|uniref:diguanylate cyclase n=1 Tax=Devosia rhodophyticola TaxID=3026423 RepID=A0ABY7YU84_9HYPH|nr:diguanylate cyclase [Devosia rhodophyticola]WDR04816.1 diguanylate cyclase [Devosia rhodophyticola]
MRQRIAASLRARVLLLVLLGFAVVAAPAYLAFDWIVGSTIVQLGTLFAEKQILYDRYRGLEALNREVSLAETLSGAQAVRDWAVDENDPERRRRGLGELEHFRQSFADKSYFFVVASSGNYYFNNASNSFAGEQYRYTISPDNPRDKWYYTTAALGDGCHLNVDNDRNLGVTKVWMNCVIREGRKVLGILGTGIDLTAFVKEVVNVPQYGVTAMFADRGGAIQAHRDRSLVAYQSLGHDVDAKKSVFSLFERPEDKARVQHLMNQVVAGGSLVRSAFVRIDGRDMLVGVGYLDKLGWFNVTLMDIDKIIDRRLFWPIGLLLGLAVLGVALVLSIIFGRQVVDRVRRLDRAVRAVQRGDFGAAETQSQSPDEIGRLSRRFADMAKSVGAHTQELEERVRERTAELEELAFRDGQTGVLNRRGFGSVYGKRTPDRQHGMLLIDIDRFKQANDSFGHAAGDAVVIEVALRISAAIGPGNFCGRWGGDEFIVLLADGAPNLLRSVAYAVMAAVCDSPIILPDGKAINVTISVGACLAEPDEPLEHATDLADTALYMAKGEGRNRVVVFDPKALSEAAPISRA